MENGEDNHNIFEGSSLFCDGGFEMKMHNFFSFFRNTRATIREHETGDRQHIHHEEPSSIIITTHDTTLLHQRPPDPNTTT